jgi:hypothetical protein
VKGAQDACKATVEQSSNLRSRFFEIDYLLLFGVVGPEGQAVNLEAGSIDFAKTMVLRCRRKMHCVCRVSKRTRTGT